jgi:hypothetical protein
MSFAASERLALVGLLDEEAQRRKLAEDL